MKKVLNITTVQQALRRLPVALLIAGSGYLQTASAVRWTIDFQDKPIVWRECTELAAAMHTQQAFPCYSFTDFKYVMDVTDEFFKCNPLAFGDSAFKNAALSFKESSKKHVTTISDEENPSWDVVLKNGILSQEEAKKFFENTKVPFSITFIRCKGVLDLNENFKKHAETIRFDDCEFETAANCFKDTKLLQFFDTKLTPTNGRLGISKSTEVQWGGYNRVLPYGMSLTNVIALEQSGKSIAEPAPDKNTGKVSNGVIESEKPFETKTDSHPRGSEEELSSPQTRHDRSGKEPAETKIPKGDNESCKAKIRQLEKEVKEKERTIDGLRAKLGESEKNEKDVRHRLLETLRSRNEESGMLVSSLEGARKDLQTAQCRNKMLENTITEMKGRNALLKKENDKLLKNKGKCETRIKDLETSKSELEKANEKLEAANNKLREEIRKSSETVDLAKKAVKRNKELEEANGKLRNAKEDANGTIERLKKDIKAWEKRWKILTDWAKYSCSLINKMKKLESVKQEVGAFLCDAGYRDKMEETKEKLGAENENNKNLKTKKGKWAEFNPDEILVDKEPNESEEEEDPKEKSNESYFGTKADGYEEDYFGDRERFFRTGGDSRFRGKQRGQRSRGRGGYYRGYNRGRRGGQLMENRRRGGYQG